MKSTQRKDSLQAIGYKAVQSSGFGPVDPREVARLVEDCGVDVAATHMGWPRFLNELDAVIDEHKMWGCTHAAIGSLPEEASRRASPAAPEVDPAATDGGGDLKNLQLLLGWLGLESTAVSARLTCGRMSAERDWPGFLPRLA